MAGKLHRDSLQADLAAVRELINQRTQEEDPVGWMNFRARAEMLEHRLQTLDQELDATASVALFFGGRPVVGSRGIEAEFGGKALEKFQNAVSTQLAALQGAVGARGPIPQRARGQLLVTDVARGSLGFVLEEAEPEGQFIDSNVKTALRGVVDLIYRIASPDEEAFESAAEAVDNRVLGTVRSFFQLMDESGATLRVVEGERDFSLQREAIEIGKRRIDDLDIREEPVEETGIFYLLPESQRFELHIDEHVIRGTVSATVVDELIDSSGRVRSGIIGNIATVGLTRRTIMSRGREPRFSYRLVSFIGNNSRIP